MKKKEFINQLTGLIKKFGYWSEQVFEFNNSMQSEIGYNSWLKWHNETKSQIK